MKRIVVVPCILIVMGNLLLLQSCYMKAESEIVREPTTVIVDTNEVDLGEIIPGTKHSVKYKIYNSGKHTLYIENILPSCDCTTVKCDKQKADPGKCVTVTLTYKAEDFSGFVYRTAEVECNTEETVILTLSGTIVN